MNAILEEIEHAQTILICGHVRPDGDCLGSAFALREYCLGLGKSADVCSPSPIPESYKFMRQSEKFNVLSRKTYDLFIAVDCATQDRIGKMEGFFRSAPRTVCIDHHEGHEGFADVNLVKNYASSTCEIVFDLLEPTGKITREIANYLYIGLSTDTGHFMHSNTDSKVMYTAYRLSCLGAECHNIATELYRSRSRNKTMLIAKSIEAMRFFMNDTVCIIPMTQELLDECNISSNDTEGIIDYAISINGVEIGISMCAEKENEYKVSFRSRTRHVNEIAAVFGGGGHIYAAGCRICGKTEDVIDKLLKAIRDTE